MADSEAKTLRLQVITPSRILYDEAVYFVVLRTEEGEIGILPGHERSVLLLDFADVKIYHESMSEQTDTLAVLGGFASVDEKGITILSDFAEHPDNIDKARLELIRERRESRASSKDSAAKLQLAEVALRRSLVRGDAGLSTLLDEMEMDPTGEYAPKNVPENVPKNVPENVPKNMPEAKEDGDA